MYTLNLEKFYTLDILKEGIIFLNLNNKEEISSIIQSNFINVEFLKKENERYIIQKKYKERFDIPKGLTKKEYTLLLKETQTKIDTLLQEIRIYMYDPFFLELEKEQYVEKKNKIKKILKFYGKKKNELNIPKAKDYPINELLDFKNGFTDCIFHAIGKQKTPSLHYDTKRNKAHCFSCHKDADAIDVYQKLFNVDFNTAVRKLS